MRISEQRVKRLIRESIRENLLREGQAWNRGGIKDFKFPHCDVSQFDPTFMKVLNLFQSDSYSGQKKVYENNSFITNLANTMGADPDFISPSLLTAFNNLLLPGAELLGKMPVGSIAICKLLTKLSKEYTSILKEAERGYNPDKLDNRPNKNKDDLPQKRQYYLNGLIKQSVFTDTIKSQATFEVKKIFKYTVDTLSQKLNEANINGFDTIFFQMFIPATIKTKGVDTNEKRQLISFYQEFKREAEYAKDLRDVLVIFNRLFKTIITYDDPEYAGFFSSGTIKHKRADIFVNYLSNDMSNLSKLFESPKDLIKTIIDELQRINKFTK